MLTASHWLCRHYDVTAGTSAGGKVKIWPNSASNSPTLATNDGSTSATSAPDQPIPSPSTYNTAGTRTKRLRSTPFANYATAATQPDPTKQPVLMAAGSGIGSLPALAFDGKAAWLAATGVDAGATKTIIAVVKSNGQCH
jgi:hypothetical protein